MMKEKNSDKESIDLSYSSRSPDTQSISSPASSTSEQIYKLGDEKEIVSRKIKPATRFKSKSKSEEESIDFSNSCSSDKQSISPASLTPEQFYELCDHKEPASRFKSNSEQVYFTYGGRKPCRLDYILQQIEALCNDTPSHWRDALIAPFSEDRINELLSMISKFMQISNHIAEDLMKVAHRHEHYRMVDQRTEEDDEEMTKLLMDGGKSGMATQAPRMDSKFKPETEAEMGRETDDEEQEIAVEQEFKMSKFKLDDDDDGGGGGGGGGGGADDEEEEDRTMAAQIHEVLQKMEKETPSHYKMKLTPLRGGEEEETEFTKSAEEEMDMEEYKFAKHRCCWESEWGSKGEWCGSFQDITTLSPMLFTHCPDGHPAPFAAITGNTLQIYSIKIVEIKGNLNWPLYVYGVVAARDTVDRNRNLLFCRPRADCQELTPEDPFLCLTGPSRAIVALDHVQFEIELKIKDGTKSRDRALIGRIYNFAGGYQNGLSTTLFDNCFCTTELMLERLTDTVQATILSVRVVEGGSWPSEYGGRVACFSPPQEVMVIDSQGTVVEVTDLTSRQVVLLDTHGEEMPIGSSGYLCLSRSVVSVQLQRKDHCSSREFKESLKVVLQAYSASGHIAAQGHVYFTPKYCNISQDTCDLGGSKVEITVAWSRLARDKIDILVAGTD